MALIKEGWEPVVIYLPLCMISPTSSMFCTLLLLPRIVKCTSRPVDKIPFLPLFDEEVQMFYGTPWDTVVWKQYYQTVNAGHIIIVNFYSDGTTMSKYGTQGVKIIRMRFPNFFLHTEKWLSIGTAPTATCIPYTLPNERRRKLKLQLKGRFIFSMIMSLVQASFSGFFENRFTNFLRMSMFTAEM